MKTTFTRRAAMLAATATFAFGGIAFAEQHTSEQVMEDLHFIIPGGAGGGWDGTARGTGEALTNSGLVGSASYENMSGGGGGTAINYMIENAESLNNTVMVNSTPIVIRSLTGVFPQSFRDLTLVAGTIGDYAAIVVPTDSDIQDMQGLLSAYNEQGDDFAVGGGSVPGGLDHLVAALVMRAAGEDPTMLNYIPYDAGGEAMAGLLSGEIDALSTGLSEAIALAEQGEVRILGITAAERVPAYDSAPTFVEQGIDTEFVNWRGFFAAPGLPEEQVTAMQQAFSQMYETEAWEDVRSRNGWVNIYNEGDDFRTFLEEQEQEIGDLMRELGFL
ncbi:Tripartite tricarboxylate transporter family receptor [Rhodobacteraceae bacterium THAF1]|uniref:tripartite tricarboxylate transporter substrate binding protein n=1 Tax=Palleronia sp. THAF1 TaxID=2587842 RepID=UPI000F419956|nr:tripartite tricarboxylate transporter substrate-binding protein [Palleronia sp. THAF1]QFU09705.1 Tripartite tricarboxylate transporter family receptor [Palleronia sp. THAF1]VDC17392.1 Tripartite tricarboxylate transporter family receptor [Rhodobacteraceae bacterium THAF1]